MSVALVCAGCASSGGEPINIAVTAVDGCDGSGADRLADVGADRLRFTVVHRAAADATAELVCDRAVEIAAGSAGSSALMLDTDVDGLLDLRVEAYANTTRVAVGAVIGINRRPRLAPLGIVLARADRASCAPGLMKAGRAFHSATVLPSGDVLLIGGLTDRSPWSSTPDARHLWVNGTIELYDPRTGTFTTVVGDRPPGRAFHSAFLLAGPPQGPYDVLLVGGVAAREAAAPVEPVFVVGGSADPLPLVPGSGARPADAVVVRFYPWADPPQVQRLTSSPVFAQRMLHAAAQIEGRAIIAGGATEYAKGVLSTVDDLELMPDAAATEHLGPFALQRSRVGAAAAPLSTDRVLLFGGNLGSSATALAADAAEVIALADPPTSSLAAYDSGSSAQVDAVAHATLTAVGSGELLLVGGLAIADGAARQPRARVAQRITSVGARLRVADVDAGGLTPRAYHRVVPVGEGGALVIGGSTAACGSGPLCGSREVYRYDPGAGGLASFTAMAVARMGHAVSKLLDGGSLLVSGGLSLEGGRLIAQRAVELLAVTGDDPFGRAPGAVSDKVCP